MSRMYIPTVDTQDWKRLLAKPDKHWKTGFSACTLAHCWQESDGFPPCAMKAFENSRIKEFASLGLLAAFPEHKVDLPGGRRASQSDLFVLASAADGLACIMIEGKVNERFGPLVSEWRKDASAGKMERLEFICRQLKVEPRDVEDCRYQLLHRTVSSVLEARRFGARHAVLLVHSFSPTRTWFEDYARFAAVLGVKDAKPDSVHSARDLDGIALYVGWACGDPVFLGR